jgi:uncharacterized protein involved in outer membrane biogenesis
LAALGRTTWETRALKKVLIGIGVLLAALVAVALVVPNFVDLNRYKGQVTSQVRAVTGRDLAIAGDIELSVLPSIALEADDIRLSNAEGASAADMVALKALRVRVALLPLLGGDVQVESVILSEPVIEIESFADGGTNLDFRPEAPAGGAKPASGGGAGGGAGSVPEAEPPIRLDSVVIENGTVIFRDQAAGTIERVENLDLTLKAASLNGPFEAEGGMTARGLPLELALKTGRMGDEPMPVAISLGATEDRGRLRFNGALSNTRPDGELSGRLEAESSDLRALLAAVMGGNDGSAPVLPAGLAQPFSLQSSLSLTRFRGNLGDVELALGETRATGALNLALADQPRADLALVVGTMDLDALLAGAAPAQAGGESAAPAAPATGTETRGKADASADPDRGEAGLPKGIAGSVDLIVDAVAYKGAVLRNLRANAVLDNGEITVNQIGALLPGGSELSVFGFLGLPEGRPRFEGTVELASDNARALLEWLQIDVAAVPADRLRKLDMAASVVATAEQVQVSDTRLALDSSNITGGITVALRDRPAFGLSVNLDRINIDAYLPADRATPAAAAKPADGAAEGSTSAPKEAEAEKPGLAALTGFDANIQARIGRLTYNDVPVRGVAFDGTLYDGVLTVNGLSVEDLAGARAAMAGSVGGFDGTPIVKGTVDVSAVDIGPLAQLAGVDLPIPAAEIGAVALKGSADTDGERVTLDMKLDAAGGSASVAGTVSDLATAPRYDIAIGLDHPQPARLFALVPGGTPPSLSELEALGLRASLKGGPGGAGGQDMAVDAALRLAGGSMTGKGLISGLGAVLAYDLDIAADFPDFVRLVRAVSPDYRPAGQTLGGLKLLAAIEGNETAAKLSTFQGSVGPVNMKGKGSVDLTGPRPSLTAEISSNEVVVDPFLAAKAGGNGGSGGGSAGGGGSAAGGGKPAERWSKEPIDFSGLSAVDAEIKVAMPALTYEVYRVVNPQIDLGIKDGVASLRSATGQIFGGALAASGRIAGAGQMPAIDLAVKADGIDVAEALKTLADTDRASGKASLEFQVESLGASEFDLVGNLNGAGQIGGDIRVHAKQEEAAGTALLGILSTQIRELQGIAGVTTSVLTAFGSGPAALSGTYQIRNGIVATEDTSLVSEQGRALATGTVDLPKWLIEMNAAVNVGTSAEPVFTARARGPLDESDIKVGGQAFTAGAQGGLGVLQQLVPGLGGLTGGSEAPAPANPTSPAPAVPAEPEEVAPQKFIKDILKGLGG